MKRVAILGATGSIGKQALEIVEHFPDELKLLGVSASKYSEELARIIERFRPQAIAFLNKEVAGILEASLPGETEFYFGEDGLVTLATREDVDLVLVAVVGIAGLLPTLEALKAGKTVALATKEALVAGGNLIREALKEILRSEEGQVREAPRSEEQIVGDALQARRGQSRKALRAEEPSKEGQRKCLTSEPCVTAPRLIPVDSEHSAIFQCLEGKRKEEVKRVILTASGGPFLHKSRAELEKVTPEQALAHPIWKMGPKISVDSATMMNKALEIIEAHFLFDLPKEQISVLIHPQGIVHGLVEFQDGSLQALLSYPDMRLPIQYALLYPRHLPSLVRPLSLEEVGKLEFEEADFERFPAFKLAYRALQMGGTAPAVLSASDEVAVKAFLDREIAFPRIVQVVEEVLESHRPLAGDTLEEVLAADRWARKEAERRIKKGSDPFLDT